jgi:hypothetical protein
MPAIHGASISLLAEPAAAAGLVQSILNAFHYKGGGEWPDD